MVADYCYLPPPQIELYLTHSFLRFHCFSAADLSNYHYGRTGRGGGGGGYQAALLNPGLSAMPAQHPVPGGGGHRAAGNNNDS